MKKQFLLFASALLLTACSKPYSVTVTTEIKTTVCKCISKTILPAK